MRLPHGRTNLELHELQPGTGPGLLLLHELYGRSADWRRREIPWPGPVYALDFTGHGDSDVLRGGAYFCEMLTADADCALAHCDATALAGAGLGAYVALLLGGARHQRIRATLLLPGRGLAGGTHVPRFDNAPPLIDNDTPRGNGSDPMLDYFERDIRPVDYASAFATHAQALFLWEGEAPAEPRPPWWQAVRELSRSTVVTGGVKEGFADLARVVGG